MASSSGSTTTRPLPFTSWTNWCKTISLWPKRSITGKTILGRINKRRKTYHGYGVHGEFHGTKEYATNKELFMAKLKGKI